MEDLLHKERTVIISGGLGDIGSAIALEFASQGAAIALGDIRPPNLANELLLKLQKLKVNSDYQQVDVKDAEAVQHWIERVKGKLGIADIIIANAATATPKAIQKITPQEWSQELRVNLDGAFYLTQNATSQLVNAQLPGHVVFVGSWAAHAVHKDLCAYSVSKAGMRMLCKCMALELAPHNILVNEIAPGYVEAGLSGKIWKQNADLRKEALEKVPVKKLLSARAVAKQVVQLCHPQNENITGSTLLMDGGLSLLS